MLFAIVVLLFGAVLAQRPSNASICDYYAMKLYGTNTTESQTKLMEGIVSLAFAGSANVSNVSVQVNGILNAGTFEGEPVNLQPWFNGSIDSTNLNNLPVGIDWLDGGETEPLSAFLNGSTTTVEIKDDTNEFRLFAHFFRAFAFVFGCTLPPPRPANETGPNLNLAYVHKYMNLNATQLGYFINQLTTASLHYGFSKQDSDTLESSMNARYNVRCAPGVTSNPAQPPQLFSLCQASSCPLAAPVSDCEAYVDLGPNGSVQQSSSSSGTSSATAPPTVATTQTVTQTQSQPAATSSGVPSTSSGSHLSSGAIAGIAIGGAALVFAFIGLLIFLLRRRRNQIAPFSGPPSNPSYATSPTYPGSPYQGFTSSQAYAPSNTDPHHSYMSGQPEAWSPPPQEMDSNDQPKISEMVQHQVKTK